MENNLRATLDAVPDDAEFSSYLRGWSSSVSTFDFGEVPDMLRGTSCARDDRLLDTPFAYRDPIPTTRRFTPPKRQQTSYRPTCVEMILFPSAIELIADWVQNYIAEYLEMPNFCFPDDVASPLQKMEYLKERGRSCEPLILGQEAFLPAARDIVWDLRRKVNGYYVPLDYDQPIETHLDLAFLKEFLKGTKDEQMLQQVTETGVCFFADADLQICLFPHLISMPPGYPSINKELLRLASDDCRMGSSNYIGIFDFFPFLPCRNVPQGSVPRKYEDRWRRVADGGGWRRPIFDRNGDEIPYTPLNVLIGPKTVDDEDAPYPFEHDTVCTTGCLGLAELPTPAPSRRLATRLPYESKPRFGDILHDASVLGEFAAVFGMVIYVMGDDAKDQFYQFRLASWEWWKVGFVWLFLEDILAARTADRAAAVKMIAEYVLGMGFSNASNIVQRFANEVMAKLQSQHNAFTRPFLTSSERTPKEKAAVDRRIRLSVVTERDQLALSTWTEYTDDPFVLIADYADRPCLFVQHALLLWARYVHGSGMRMAIAEKRTLGAAGVWCGLLAVPCLGHGIIPRDKVVRACVGLQRLAAKDESMQFHELRSLNGLLQHLLSWVNNPNSAMFGLYYPFVARPFAGPTDVLDGLITNAMVDRANNWLSALATTPGILATDVFPSSRTDPDRSPERWFVYGDAAGDGTDTPGLGGYMHSFGWRIPLEAADVVGDLKMPIPVLEYAAIGANMITSYELVPQSSDADVIIGSDSITSVDQLLNLHGKSDTMQFVTLALGELPEMRAWRHRLYLGHVYGSGNVFADAESRGYDDSITALARQLGIKYRRPQVPQRALDFVDAVRRFHRRHVRASAAAADGATALGRRRRQHAASSATPAATPDSDGVFDISPTPQPNPAARPQPMYPAIDLVDTADPDVADPSLGPGSPACDAADGPTAGRLPTPAAMAMTPPRKRKRDDDDETRPLPDTPPMPPRKDERVDRGPSPHRPPPSPVVRQPDNGRNYDIGAAPTTPSGKSGLHAPTAQAPAQSAGHASFAPPPFLPPIAEAAPAAEPATSRRAVAMEDFSPLEAPSRNELIRSLLSDTSPLALRPTDPTLLPRLIDDVFTTFADSAALRTIGADKAAWRKWKRFLVRFGHSTERNMLWRNDINANNGTDPIGFQREVFLLRAFLVDTHRNMRPRRRTSKRAKPRSSLNTVAGIRRIHKRAGIEMVGCSHLGVAIRGLNRQYMDAEGKNSALLIERKEPLGNHEAAAMTDPGLQGLRLPPWQVDWSSLTGVSFKAALRLGRQGAFRKACMLSLDVFEVGDMSRGNLSWYLRHGDGYEHFGELPPGKTTLTDGECACVRPPPSKADQSGETFGNHLCYLPYISDDPNNAAAALLDLELALPCAGDQRDRVPLFIVDPDFAPLDCNRGDALFAALALHALGAKRAAQVSFHSCRIWAASALLAVLGEGHNDTIQALCRWRTDASIKIYGRMNPANYAAHVRRMAVAATPSLLSSNVPHIDNDDFHANIGAVVGPLESGRDIADTCDVDTDDDSDDDDAGIVPTTGTGPPPAATRPVQRRRRQLCASAAPISVQQANPKRSGTASHARYEAYKAARTEAHFRELGGSAADLAHDRKRGYITDARGLDAPSS